MFGLPLMNIKVYQQYFEQHLQLIKCFKVKSEHTGYRICLVKN